MPPLSSLSSSLVLRSSVLFLFISGICINSPLCFGLYRFVLLLASPVLLYCYLVSFRFLLISFHIGKKSLSLCSSSLFFFYILCCIVIAYCPNFAGLNTSSGSFLVVVAADGGDCSNGDVVVTVLVPSVSGSY